jgi:hypothetical protein
VLQLKWVFCLKKNRAKIGVDEMPMYRIAFSFRDFVLKTKLYEVLFFMKEHSFSGSSTQLLVTNRDVTGVLISP